MLIRKSSWTVNFETFLIKIASNTYPLSLNFRRIIDLQGSGYMGTERLPNDVYVLCQRVETGNNYPTIARISNSA